MADVEGASSISARLCLDILPSKYYIKRFSSVCLSEGPSVKATVIIFKSVAKAGPALHKYVDKEWLRFFLLKIGWLIDGLRAQI